MPSTPVSGDDVAPPVPPRDPTRPFALRLDASELHDPAPPGSAEMVLLEGPWVQAFGVSIGSPLRSKSNLRRHRRGNRQVWAENAAFEQELSDRVEELLPAGWDVGEWSTPLAGRPQIVAHVAAVTLIDAPNTDKSVLDALQGVAFLNDASVRASSQQTVRRRADQTAWIGLARLDPDATAAEVAAAHVALLAAWVELGAPPFEISA